MVHHQSGQVIFGSGDRGFRLRHGAVLGYGVAVLAVLNGPQRIAHGAGGVVGVDRLGHGGVGIALGLGLHGF